MALVESPDRRPVHRRPILLTSIRAPARDESPPLARPDLAFLHLGFLSPTPPPIESELRMESSRSRKRTRQAYDCDAAPPPEREVVGPALLMSTRRFAGFRVVLMQIWPRRARR